MSNAPRNTRVSRPAGRAHDSNRRRCPPGPQGLYDPRFEHDACGVGFVVDIKGRRSHRILEQAIQVLQEPRPPRRVRRGDQHR